MLSGATVHTRRPHARYELGDEDGALLELLHDRARASDLEPTATIDRLVRLLRERFGPLARAALSEPPRVRAMLGEQAGHDVDELRASLNPLSRFDFGPLAALPTRGPGRPREASPASRRGVMTATAASAS